MTLDLVVWNTTEASEVFIVPHSVSSEDTSSSTTETVANHALRWQRWCCEVPQRWKNCAALSKSFRAFEKRGKGD
eukprot:symbB.v1.2.024261.t1/scaffold2277.1/size96038/4